jgi:hypothetical protein
MGWATHPSGDREEVVEILTGIVRLVPTEGLRAVTAAKKLNTHVIHGA